MKIGKMDINVSKIDPNIPDIEMKIGKMDINVSKIDPNIPDIEMKIGKMDINIKKNLYKTETTALPASFFSQTKTKSNMAKSRVDIPLNSKELIDLGKKVYEKHTVEAENSPLKPLNWASIGPTLPQALLLHNQAEALQKQMESAYEQRDKLLKPITDIVRASRDILTGVYQKEMKKLGDWGYDVADAGSGKPAKATKKQ
jgi:hypothetical protein